MRTDTGTQSLARIVVKFKDSLELPYDEDEEIQNYFSGEDSILKKIFENFPGISVNKLFDSLSKDEIIDLVETVNARHRQRNHELQAWEREYKSNYFFTYFAIDCPDDVDPGRVVTMLKENENVTTAYIQSGRVPSPTGVLDEHTQTAQQGYLDPAPKGINARYAWTHDGGEGQGLVRLVDIEYSWNSDHEDLRSAALRFLWGDRNETFFKGHGTSVLGVLLMQDNNVGGMGISPKVVTRLVSQTSPKGVDSIPNAILRATSYLNEGDVLLLEVQAVNSSGIMLLPCEIEDATFDMIQFASNKGIIVIEVAGNGQLGTKGQDLDELSVSGKNILDPESADFRDSGAIMVGAASGSEDHGKTVDSNYGDRIDCFAWGNDVFSAGDRSNDPPNNSYTRDFSGTSSAAAIIAGAAVVVQSIAEASGKRRITPFEMRQILSKRRNGTSSPNRIGVMPDLKKIIDHVIPNLPEQ